MKEKNKYLLRHKKTIGLRRSEIVFPFISYKLVHSDSHLFTLFALNISLFRSLKNCLRKPRYPQFITVYTYWETEKTIVTSGNWSLNWHKTLFQTASLRYRKQCSGYYCLRWRPLKKRRCLLQTGLVRKIMQVIVAILINVPGGHLCAPNGILLDLQTSKRAIYRFRDAKAAKWAMLQKEMLQKRQYLSLLYYGWWAVILL